jgi:hypothetical protein
MSGLLDALRQDQDPRRGACHFCEWLRSRPAAEQKEWREALADRSFTTASLIRQALKRGYAGGRSTPETHRKNDHAF